jgi:two-component system response regulator AtoC
VSASRAAAAGDPILLVEDRDALRTMLRHALEAQGHGVVEAVDAVEAAEALRRVRPGLVLTDLRLPRGDGLEVLRAAKDADPDVPVIVMTAYGAVQDAVAAMKDGALDFLAKPVDPEHLFVVVARALRQQRLAREHAALKQDAATRRGAPQVIGAAPALLRALDAARRAAPSDVTVLLEGESGTGKELFARTLHALGSTPDGPFVAINCAAIPETLLESELFGYEKGAFTGALQRKQGRFELAHRGTLFLDEVGELPLALQAKLLRVLETQAFERVGGTATIHVKTRIVAATNRQLRQAVAARQFREDLFFRLSVLPVGIPPLRERPGDVAILAQHFVVSLARELGRAVPVLTPAALDALDAYPWPGNVRELQNCLERAVILADGEPLQPRHLRLTEPIVAAPSPWDAIDLSGTLDEASTRVLQEVERRKMTAALAEAAGDHARAATALGLAVRAFTGRARALGLIG